MENKKILFVIPDYSNDKLKYLRILHLKGERHGIECCKNCEYIRIYKNEYDDIDDAGEELMHSYKYSKDFELPPENMNIKI